MEGGGTQAALRDASGDHPPTEPIRLRWRATLSAPVMALSPMGGLPRRAISMPSLAACIRLSPNFVTSVDFVTDTFVTGAYLHWRPHHLLEPHMEQGSDSCIG